MMTLSNNDIDVQGRLCARHLPSALPTTIVTSGAEQEVDRQVYIFLSSDNAMETTICGTGSSVMVFFPLSSRML